jgi:hypothetical protein
MLLKIGAALVSSRRNKVSVYYTKARARLGFTNCELFDLVLSCQRRKMSFPKVQAQLNFHIFKIIKATLIS